MTNHPRKKRLLLLPWEYPYRPGEAPFIEPELPALTSRFDVSIAACLNDGTATDAPVPCPVPFAPAGKGPVLTGLLGVLTDGYFYRELVSAARSCPLSLFRRRAGLIFYSYLHAHRFADSLDKTYFKSGAPDVCYSFWGRESAYALTLLKRRYPKLQIVSRFHGCDLYAEHAKQNYLPFRPALNRCLDAFLFISDSGRDYYSAANPAVPQGLLHTCFLGCGAVPHRAAPDFSRLVIASCSRIMPEKRLPLLVSALATLKDAEIEWHHVGDGAGMEELKRLSEDLLDPLPNIRYVFHGAMENKSIRPLYEKIGARLLLNVSSSEGLPVTMMEAFSIGLPVVGTNVGGVNEIVTDETGVLLPADPAPEEIASALTAFSKLSEPEWRRLSENAYAVWANRFDANANAARFSAFLAAL